MKLGTPVICDSVPIITPLLQTILSQRNVLGSYWSVKAFFSPLLGVPGLLPIWQVSVFPLIITWYHSVASKPSKLVKIVSLPLHSLLNQQILPFGDYLLTRCPDLFLTYYQIFLFGMSNVTKGTHLRQISKRPGVNCNI